MKKVHIAMVVDGRDPLVGGVQTHVKNLIQYLVQDYNCSIDLFTRKLPSGGKKIIENKGIDYINVYKTGYRLPFESIVGKVLGILSITWKLYREARKKKYDIIHAHNYTSEISAKIVGWLTKTPVVYTVHTTSAFETKKGIITRIQRKLVCSITYDLLIGVSKKILDYPNKSKKTLVIPNGVNVGVFDSVQGITKENGFHMIWVGRLTWEKGIDILIQAVGLIDRDLLEQSKVMFHLVGDGPMKANYEHMIKNYKLSDFFIFEGRLQGEQLIQKYKENTLFILPSITEAQPITLLEAFASKLPVIVTDVGDNASLVYNDINGWIVPPQNPKILAHAIGKAIQTDQDILKSYGDYGYQLVKKDYTREIITRKTYQAYQLLLS